MIQLYVVVFLYLITQRVRTCCCTVNVNDHGSAPVDPILFIIEMRSPREVPLHVVGTLFVVAAPVCSRFQMRGKRLCLFWSWHAALTSSVIKF